MPCLSLYTGCVFAALVFLTAAGCHSGDSGGSGDGDGDGDDATTSDEAGPDLPQRDCVDDQAAPLCDWMSASEIVSGASELGPNLPNLPDYEYFHGPHDFELVVQDGVVHAAATWDFYATGDVGEELRLGARLIYGRDVDQTWEPQLELADLWTESLAVDVNGAVHLSAAKGTASSVLSDETGEWLQWSANDLGPTWVLPLESDPATLAFLGRSAEGLIGGSLVGEEAKLSGRMGCPQGVAPSTPAIALSPAEEVFAAYMMDTESGDVGLYVAHEEEGTWTHEAVACLYHADQYAQKTEPDLAIGADGTLHACATFEATGDNWQTWYYTDASGKWEGRMMGEAQCGGSCIERLCDVGVDDSGRVHVRADIEYSVFESGAWSEPTPYADDAWGPSRYARMDVSPSGDVYIAWPKSTSLALSTLQDGVWAHRILVESPWDSW